MKKLLLLIFLFSSTTLFGQNSYCANNPVWQESRTCMFNLSCLEMYHTNHFFTARVYPNPSSEFVNIETGNSQMFFSKIDISNSIGQIISKETFLPRSSIQVNVANLKEGICFLKMKSSNAESNYHLLVKLYSLVE